MKKKVVQGTVFHYLFIWAFNPLDRYTLLVLLNCPSVGFGCGLTIFSCCVHVDVNSCSTLF